MNTAQLLWAAAAVASVVAGGCNRAETSREAREAAADVRHVAAVAGERLADSWLTTKVQAQFFADDDIKARYITVTSRDGVVTLKGFVDSDAVRQEALQIARSTDGVKQIDDQLKIGQAPSEAFDPAPPDGTVATTGPGEMSDSPAAAGVHDDGLIVSRIQARFFLDPSVKRRHIDVTAANGVVTLRGQVASDNERAQALLLARTTEGVVRVEDNLTIDAALGAPPVPLGASANPAVQPAPAPNAPAARGRAATPGGAAPGGAGPRGATPGGATPGSVGTSGATTADARIESMVQGQLTGDAELQGASVEVSARDGVVLLQGTVATPAAKGRLLTLARGTEGVVQVVDRVTVRGGK